MKELPGFWKPFASLPVAILAGPVVAALSRCSSDFSSSAAA